MLRWAALTPRVHAYDHRSASERPEGALQHVGHHRHRGIHRLHRRAGLFTRGGEAASRHVDAGSVRGRGVVCVPAPRGDFRRSGHEHHHGPAADALRRRRAADLFFVQDGHLFPGRLRPAEDARRPGWLEGADHQLSALRCVLVDQQHGAAAGGQPLRHGKRRRDREERRGDREPDEIHLVQPQPAHRQQLPRQLVEKARPLRHQAHRQPCPPADFVAGRQHVAAARHPKPCHSPGAEPPAHRRARLRREGA